MEPGSIDVPQVSPRGFVDKVLPSFRPKTLEGRDWEQIGDLTYVTGKGYKIVVPSGNETDFASIPKIVWSLSGFDPYGPAKFPGAVHDYLYSLRGGNFPDGSEGFTRKECDEILLEALQNVSVRYSVRITMYYAVRIFGGFHSRGIPWKK